MSPSDVGASPPTARALWERAGYLRAAAVDAYDAYVAAYAAVDAAHAADAVYVDAYDEGVARWAREHHTTEGKP